MLDKLNKGTNALIHFTLFSHRNSLRTWLGFAKLLFLVFKNAISLMVMDFLALRRCCKVAFGFCWLFFHSQNVSRYSTRLLPNVHLHSSFRDFIHFLTNYLFVI